jgi:citrate synthase
MLQSGGVKIWRPRQLYVGEGARDYVDARDRQAKDNAGVFDGPVEVLHGGESRRNRLAIQGDMAAKPRL